MSSTTFRFRSDAVDDVFVVTGFEGTESISRLYQYRIDLKAPTAAGIDLDAALDSTARLVAETDGFEFPVNGMLASFDERQTAGDYTHYTALLVPRIWKLTTFRSNEIYTSEKTVDQIIASVLDAAGFANGYDYDTRGLTGTFLERDYVCQFRESDFDFLARLMENEGIYFYFQQKPDMETMIIANGAVHHPLPFPDAVFDAGGLHDHRRQRVSSWVCRKQRLPMNVTVRDYNPDQPSLDVAGRTDIDPSGYGTEYLYGDNFADESEARYLADIRAEEFTCRKTRYFGEGTLVGLVPGFTFNLTSHPNERYNNLNYILLEISHRASGLDDTAVAGSGGPEYHNNFTAIEEGVQFRPPLLTPKPRFYGTMTAFVHAEAATGMAEVDLQGRYRVHLPFDRAEGGKSSDDPDRKASAWIRMAQPYVGEDEGMYFPLRGGTEVLLTFINGDPDRPIISGAVPNASTPALLTSDKPTESIIRSKGNNKIRMEDLPGKERIVIDSPHSNSWIRVGAHNDPVTLNGYSPMYIEEGDGWEDPGAKAVASDGTVSQILQASSVSGPNQATGVDSSVTGTYTLTYTSGNDSATREVVVYATAESNLVDTVADTDGVRIRSAGNMWLESRSRSGEYVVGAPAPDTLPRKSMTNDTAPSELGDLVGNFGNGYNPTGLKNYVTGAAVSFAGATAGSLLAGFKQGHVKVSSLDTFNTQEGNIYDFGGYWNYNLGNSYEEAFIKQDAAGNGTGADRPAALNQVFSNQWPSDDDLGGTSQGERIASGIATGLVMAAVSPAAAIINAGLTQGLAQSPQQRNVGDCMDEGGPQVGSATKTIQTDEAKVRGMNTGNSWVTKKFGNDYEFFEGNAIEIRKGDTESHNRGNTYEYTYGGVHEETSINGAGIKTSWTKSGGGEFHEHTWDPGTGTFLSATFKKRGQFTASTEHTRAWPTLSVSNSMTNLDVVISFSMGAQIKIDTGMSANVTMEVQAGLDFKLEAKAAGELKVKVAGGKIITNFGPLSTKIKGIEIENSALKNKNAATDLKNALAKIDNGTSDIKNQATVISNALATLLN